MVDTYATMYGRFHLGLGPWKPRWISDGRGCSVSNLWTCFKGVGKGGCLNSTKLKGCQKWVTFDSCWWWSHHEDGAAHIDYTSFTPLIFHCAMCCWAYLPQSDSLLWNQHLVGNKPYRVHIRRPRITLIACLHCEEGISIQFWNPDVTFSSTLIYYDHSNDFEQFESFSPFNDLTMPQNIHGVFLHIKIVLPRMPLPLHTHGLGNVTTWLTNLKWPRICGIHVDDSGGLALMKYPLEEEEELGVKVIFSCWESKIYSNFGLFYVNLQTPFQTTCIQRWLWVLCWRVTTWPPPS